MKKNDYPIANCETEENKSAYMFVATNIARNILLFLFP